MLIEALFQYEELFVELYFEDELPGMVAYGDNSEAIEMDPDPEHHSIIAPPSYQSESILYAPSEPDGGIRLPTSADRAPRYG